MRSRAWSPGGVVRQIRYGLACLLLSASPALAEQRRVALVDADPQLERAVLLSLSPWGVDTQVTHEASPGATRAEAGPRAAALSRKLDASVLVWVSPAAQGALLWIYETESGELSVRELAEAPPFGSEQAAAVALSIKTLLRTTDVAPQSERVAATARTPTPTPTPTPTSDRVPPRPHAWRRFKLEAGTDLRFTARATSEGRLALGGTWWALPVTLTQSLSYLALVAWAARRGRLDRRTGGGILEARGARV